MTYALVGFGSFMIGFVVACLLAAASGNDDEVDETYGNPVARMDAWTKR